MAIFSQIWAQDPAAIVVAPTEGQIDIGFTCGEAPLGIFNWLFQNLMSTINTLNIGDVVSKYRNIYTTEGIAGGGDLENDLTLRLDFDRLEPVTDITDTDVLAIYRSGVHKKVTRASLVAGLGGGGGGGGGIAGGSNVGTGEGPVFLSVSGSNLQFRNIKAGTGVQVAVSTNDIVVSLGPLAGALTMV